MDETGTSWFSTRVRLAAIIGEGRASRWMDCVHVFRAEGWDAAFQRALDLGRSHEDEYENADGLPVRWRLVEVVSLDLLAGDDLDGAEVYSEITEAGLDGGLPPEIAPERSTPTQTI